MDIPPCKKAKKSLSENLFEMCENDLMVDANSCRYASKSKRARVPKVAFDRFEKALVEPDRSEGISEIELVDFFPLFRNQEERELFTRWYSF
jgi:uncharacterized protein YprB with RNaseH-like and TPR domain